MTIDTSYRATVGRIRPVIPILCDALQHGIDLTETYWTQRDLGRGRYPQLWTHLVRTHALESLHEHGLSNTAEDEDDLSTPPMSALLIQYGYDVLKVRLSRDGEVPVPGPSRALNAYYAQQPQIEGMETNNLLVLWNHEAGRLVEPLTLVRPVGGGHRLRDVAVGWSGNVGREVATLRATDLDELRPIHEQQALGSDDTA